VGGTGYVGLQTGTNRNIICGTTKGTTNQLYLGCADGRILKAVTNSIVPVDNINVCSIKDIHFNEVGSGVIVETNGRIRYTYNIANGWEIPSLPSANNIPSWNAGIIAEDDQIRIVGESIIAKIEENEVVTVGGNLSASFIGVEHIETSDKFVYVGNAGSQGEIRIETNGTFAVNSYAGKPFSECSLIPGANRIGAVYSTGINQSLAIIEINSNSILDNQIALSCSGIRDIAFNDMMHFMAVGDNGLWKAFEIVLTSDLNSPDYTGASISAATDLNPVSTVFSQQSDVTGFDFSAIAYSGSHKGILGANYNGGIEHCTRRFEEMSGEYSTLFYYDKLGRIVLSQNSKQQGNVTSNENQKYYSYTLYDGLGRVYEAGVKAENATSEIQFRNIMGDYVNNTYNPNVINDVNLIEWLETGSMEVDINNDLVPDAVSNPTRTEITRSLYDEAVDDVYTTAIPSDFVQSNLRKRVSAIYYMETWVDNMEIDELPLFNSATYYSYDIHGNVNTLIQDNPAMTLDNVSYAQQRFKRMDYVYDLISGNVHQMSYQSGKSDAWHHHYTYDADNRIKEVFTSKQPNPIAWTSYTSGNPGWDLDAKYFYYEHGPLARVELGDNQVQGVDYAYTLQGWLKGTNSNSLDANRDMGQDGNANNALNQYIARDAYSYSLGYYEGDYESVNAGSVSPLPQWYAETDGGDIDNQSNDLWNGNIGIMQTTLMRSDNQGVLTAENLGMAYNYDQLNRLKDAKGYLDFNYTNNAWESTGESAKFKNSFTFDANGNINSQKRYQFERTTTNPIAGTDVLVDDLVYKYHESDPTSPTASRRISNRLYSVNDAVADLSYPDDIHDMGEYMYPTQTNPTVQVNGDNNYIYSKIGELVGDAQEEIDEIVWRVDSKIKEVKRSASSDKKSLKFEYDPMGNRIAKYVYDGEMLESSTFYVRDAQGTTIAVYDEKMITEVVNSTSITTVKYALAERHIYGSSRLGMDTTEVVVPQNEMVIAPTSETTITRHLKKKLYELSNHLGNVLTVISDMKVPVGNEATGVLEYYNPHIISVTDYSPFGVALSARTWSEQEYRFGFNGKDKESEFNSGAYDFGARIHDARLGRWMSVDEVRFLQPGWTPYRYCFNNPMGYVDPDGKYETDGHYWTIYLVGLMLGMEQSTAREIARQAEYWDNSVSENGELQRYTWNDGYFQQEVHTLTGGLFEVELRNTLIMIINPTELNYYWGEGALLHRLGDCFAHSKMDGSGEMYGGTLGYTFQHYLALDEDYHIYGSRPDKIYERPTLYLDYVSTLADVLSMQYNLSMDGFDECKFQDLATYADTYNVSLVGIMNYEIASYLGKSEFYVSESIGALPSKASHLEVIQNTKDYLNRNGVSYSTEEVYNENGTYISTKFILCEE
jgi:RHS repeat-associated protein